MNDQLSGQLGWTIPAYARDLLWLESEAGAVRVEGAQGLFTLDAPAQVLTLRWGSADGPALTQLRWQVDSLEWDGSVRIGGYIDAMHITELDDLPAPITILHVGGQPLKPEVSAYPTRARAAQRPLPRAELLRRHRRRDRRDGHDLDGASKTAPALTLAQDALVSKLRRLLLRAAGGAGRGLARAFRAADCARRHDAVRAVKAIEPPRRQVRRETNQSTVFGGSRLSVLVSWRLGGSTLLLISSPSKIARVQAGFVEIVRREQAEGFARGCRHAQRSGDDAQRFLRRVHLSSASSSDGTSVTDACCGA